MKRAGRIALAVGIGYVLGRKRKLRAALLLGAAAATGRGPAGRLLGGGSDDTPAGDGGMLGRLGEAGKAAARTAAGRPIDLLAERLNDGAEGLRRAGKPGGGAGRQSDRGDDQEPGQLSGERG
jgi:hypothetical protein